MSMSIADLYGVRSVSVTGVNAAGVVTIVAAVTDATIHILGYVLNAATAVTIKLQSKPAGTATELTGTTGFSLPTNGVIASGFNPYSWFSTGVGEAFQMTLGGTSAVSGHVVYAIEPALTTVST
jgi:hypothetical protein